MDMLKTGGNVLSMITSRRINRFTPIENDSLETDVVERDRKQSSNAYSVQVRTAHLGNRDSRVKIQNGNSLNGGFYYYGW